MFEISEEALDKILEFLAGSERPKPIRILMAERGWKTPALVMALDEERENDEIFHERGVSFVVGKKLFEKVKPIRIKAIHIPLWAWGIPSVLNSIWRLKRPA